jgi:hypothetical protein
VTLQRGLSARVLYHNLCAPGDLRRVRGKNLENEFDLTWVADLDEWRTGLDDA